MKSAYSILFLFLIISLSLGHTTLAQENSSSIRNHRNIRHTFKNGIDPTLFITRVELQNAYVDRSSAEGYSNTTRARIDYAVSDRLRLTSTVPYTYRNREQEEEQDGSSFGDSTFGILVKPLELKHSALALGVDFEFDTGDPEKDIGRGKNIFAPILAASHEFEAVPELLLIVFATPKFSFGGGDDSPDVNELLLRFQIHRPFYERFWWLVEEETKIDFEESGDTELILASEVGIMALPELGFWLKPSIDLHGTARESDWSILAGLRYLFF